MDKIVLMSNQEEKVGSTTFLFFSVKYFQIFFNIWIDHERAAWL